MSNFLKFVLLAALLTACGPVSPVAEQPLPTRAISTQPIPPQPLSTATVRWTSIALTQSGGFIGMLKTIRVDNKGAFTVRDERAQTNASGQLTLDQLAQLNLLVKAVSHLSPSQTPTNCADCFIYVIEISTSGNSVQLEADDVSLADSKLAPLVSFLRGIMEQPPRPKGVSATPTKEIYTTP